MFTQLSCVVVDMDVSARQEMANFLASDGINVSMLSSLEALPKALGNEPPPRLALINLDPAAQETLTTLGGWIRQFPATSFFVMSKMIDASLLMEAIHLGVREFVPLPVNKEKLLASIERVADVQGMGERARIINFVPVTGGCGCTTLACNVAASLAKTGKTLLLDLDLVRGNVASTFDVRPRYTISNLMDSSTAMDKALLDNALTVHAPSGLSILARPDHPEEAQKVTEAGFARLLGSVQRLFDYVVLDSAMSVDPLYATVMKEADVNVLVMQLNVPSAKNAERFLAAMRRADIDAAKIKIIVNRFHKRGSDIDRAEVERALGAKISWTVPNDFKTAMQATNLGEPVVLRSPKAEMSEAIHGLSHMLNGKIATSAVHV